MVSRSTLIIGRLVLALTVALFGLAVAAPTMGSSARASAYTPRTSITVAPGDLVGCRNCTTSVQPANHEWDGPVRGGGVLGNPILPPPHGASTLNYHWKSRPGPGVSQEGHGLRLMGSEALAASPKACPKAKTSTRFHLAAIRQQGGTYTLNCSTGFQGWAQGEIRFAGNSGTVNGYFKFQVTDTRTGFQFWVTTGNFSWPASYCSTVCWPTGSYRGGASTQVNWVQFWADVTGNIYSAGCNP